MKFVTGCSGDCHVCGSENCDLDYKQDRFARASLETILKRMDNHEIMGPRREATKVWLKIQFDYDYKED